MTKNFAKKFNKIHFPEGIHLSYTIEKKICGADKRTLLRKLILNSFMYIQPKKFGGGALCYYL